MAVNIKWERDRCPVTRTGSLKLVGQSYTLRCDAKQAEKCFYDFQTAMGRIEVVQLGCFFPRPFVKGAQPKYLETLDPEGVPVINTLAIQKLRINIEACRHISEDDFERLSEERRLRQGDVLLTLDGGTSIGKPVYFQLDDDFTVDSHVAILRPEGIDPLVLVYLLASPFGQLQFQLAESGASGQTAVTEEDIRRFVFPKTQAATLSKLVSTLHKERGVVGKEAAVLEQREREAWQQFNEALINGAAKKRKDAQSA